MVTRDAFLIEEELVGCSEAEEEAEEEERRFFILIIVISRDNW